MPCSVSRFIAFLLPENFSCLSLLTYLNILTSLVIGGEISPLGHYFYGRSESQSRNYNTFHAQSYIHVFFILLIKFFLHASFIFCVFFYILFSFSFQVYGAWVRHVYNF